MWQADASNTNLIFSFVNHAEKKILLQFFQQLPFGFISILNE